MTTRYRWPILVLAVVLLLIGLMLFGGGVWLVALGGSAYYVLAGIAIIASGVLLWRGRREGALLYLVVFAFTVIWALWEVGLDAWALVPRVAGPAVLAIAVALMVPLSGRRSGETS